MQASKQKGNIMEVRISTASKAEHEQLRQFKDLVKSAESDMEEGLIEESTAERAAQLACWVYAGTISNAKNGESDPRVNFHPDEDPAIAYVKGVMSSIYGKQGEHLNNYLDSSKYADLYEEDGDHETAEALYRPKAPQPWDLTDNDREISDFLERLAVTTDADDTDIEVNYAEEFERIEQHLAAAAAHESGIREQLEEMNRNLEAITYCLGALHN